MTIKSLSEKIAGLLLLWGCLTIFGTAQTPPPIPPPVEKENLRTLPLGKGLPLVVRVGMVFVDISAIDENENTFAATVDLRLRWTDFRLAFPAGEAPSGFKEFRMAEAEAKLAEIWAPQVGWANLKGEPSLGGQGIRVFPDGQVEYMQRVKAQFFTSFQMEQFPFDRQNLRVELISRRESKERMVFDFRQDDLTFSRVGENVELDGWEVGLVGIQRESVAGWYGESQPALGVTVEITRHPGTALAPIFIPLFASLLIPLLALWLNRVENGWFQIEAFELANILIGGLFAVIALNFTVNSDYRALAGGDNTVTRLFALNYLTLGVSIVINIGLFRFNLVQRFFGKHVQEQVFLYLVWALPSLALVSAGAILLIAWV